MIPVQKIKAVKIEDTGSNVIQLSRGTWLVDGKEYVVDSYQGVEVVVSDPTALQYKREETFKDYYIGLDDTKITVDQFEQMAIDLKKKGYADEDQDNGWYFQDLDDEYNYKKFCREWKCVYGKNVTWDNVELEETFIQLKTDNPYIVSMYTTESCKSSDSLLYTYSRNSATLFIVWECFKSLGLEFVQKVEYLATVNKKVWGNSGTNHLKSVVAFGSYIFNDNMPNVKGQNSQYKGTLAQCKTLYEADKKAYEDVIKSKYAAHFLRGSLGEVLTGDVLSKLEGLHHQLVELEVKQKSESRHRTCKASTLELIKLLRESLVGQVEGVK